MFSLDLSFNSIIEDENLNNDFREIAKNNKKIYFNLIDDLNYINNNNLLWLSSITSSRNIFISRIFFYLCLRIFIDKNIDQISKYKNIIVDNKIIYKYLLTHKIEKNKIKSVNFVIVSDYFLKYKYLFINLLSIFFLKFFSKKNKLNKSSYFFQIPISSYYKIDNSLSGLNYLSNNFYKNKIIYVPYLISKKFFEILNLSKMSKKKEVIIKQKYISINQYFKIFKTLTLDKNVIYPDNLNLFQKKIISHEINRNLYHPTSFDSLEFFYFVKNLSKKNIDSHFISIYENSIINKLWHFAINKYFSKSTNNGIKVMIPVRNYFSQYYISISEYKNKLIPKKIILGSKKLKKQLSADNSHLINTYVDGPFIRLSNNNNIKKKRAIIFFSSILDFETSKIISSLKDIQIFNNYEYYIKFHPSLSSLTNDKYSKIIPKIFKIDKDLTINDFDNESIIISGMSTILVDAINSGLNSIYFDVKFYLPLNPMLDDFNNSQYFHFLNNIDDLNSRLDFIIKNKSFNREEQNIYTKLDKSNSNLIFQ